MDSGKNISRNILKSDSSLRRNLVAAAMTLFLWVFCCGTVSAGSDFSIREIPLLNKFPSRCVITIFQDSQGEMWFGTEEGLCRSNGYNIKVYLPGDAPESNPAGNRVNCITEHTSGDIWFGTPKGVYAVSKRTRKVREIDAETLAGLEIIWMLTTSDGCTWISTPGKIFRYCPEGKLKKSYAVEWNGKKGSANRFLEDSKKNLWITVQGGGISRYDARSDSWKALPWPYKEGSFCMLEDCNGNLFVGTWLRGIVKFNPHSSGEEMFTPATERDRQDERQGAVIAMAQDNRRGLIWAATMRGLDSFEIQPDGSLSRIENPGNVLPKYQMITDLMKDDEGLLWVSGYNIPSYVVAPTSGTKHYSLPEITRQSGHISTISSLSSDKSDPSLLWLFQERHRLYLYDRNSGKAVSDIENLFESTHNNLGNLSRLIPANGTHGGTWALCHTPETVYRLENGGTGITVTEQLHFPMEAGTLLCMADCGEECLYVGTENGLYLHAPGTGLRCIGSGYAVKAVCANGGRLYVVRKAPCADGGSVIAAYSADRLISEMPVPAEITAIASAPDGSSLWIGDSRGEVRKVENKKISANLSNISEYVPAGGIQSLFPDSCGNLWIQTDQRVTEVDILRKKITHYNAGDPSTGLFNFFSDSRCVLADGTLLFGGTGGICRMEPSADTWMASGKKLFITEITVDGESIDIPEEGGELTLPPYCQSVSIEFAVPEHFRTSEIVYAYRIGSGKDGEWVQLPQGYNVVHLNNLPKGAQKFEVRRVGWGEEQTASIAPLSIFREPKVHESWWFYALLVVVCVYIGFTVVKMWGRHKAALENRKMEEELIRLKFNFFTNITHELRTPLSLILTPLDSMISRAETPRSREELEGIRRNAEDLLTLINRILNFRKLEVGGEKLNPVRGNLVEFMEAVVSNFTPLAEKKGINFSFTTTCRTLMGEFDADKMKIILNNLLSNAFKFTERNGTVHLRLDTTFSPKSGTSAVITLSDTGKGIAQNHIPHVLDAFYQVGSAVAADGTAGSGIGLYLVREYVNMHGGSISIKSKENSGTEIRVSIPMGAEKEAVHQPDEEREQPFTRNPDKKLVLITEDNDEFRAFLRRELSGTYDVIEAADGDEGLRMVHKYYPDIIVSDVMMPRMSGFDFCREVKQDVSVCDIPVILLTARIDESSRMEGFENKADSYITKPFKLDMLLNRIEHLISTRRKRQDEYRDKPEASPEKLQLNPLDEQLLNKLILCVTKNLDNSEYSIAELSEDMNMSRMNLYRKIMAITGQSPTDFVKTQRLKKAAAMLAEGTHTIVEIADATGFSSASYFTRIFKAQFGQTPSQYAENQKKVR